MVQSVIQGDAIKPGGSIKYYAYLVGLVNVKHRVMWQIPGDLRSLGGLSFTELNCISLKLKWRGPGKRLTRDFLKTSNCI